MRYRVCQFCKDRGLYGVCYNDCCIDGNRFEPAMTPESFAEKMIRIKNKYNDDTEEAHRTMDHIMCELLTKLGYEHGVKVFKDTDKWYV